MKISHAQLSQCHKNPATWVAKQLNQDGSSSWRGYEYCLREGIYPFHRDEDIQAARQYTEQRLFNQRLITPHRIQDVLERFDAYISWYISEGIIVIDSRVRLDFELGHGIILGGLVSRIDMIQQGYRAVLLETIQPGWKEELRMPLIQRALAAAYERPENEFVVGIQELDASELTVTSYSQTDMDNAEQIAQQLARQVAVELAKHQSR
jgi:hypothetical protein